MDLRQLEAVPTDAEREAVDDVLGAPTSGWEGGERRPALEGHVSRGGHESLLRRHLLLPALHAVQAGIGWINLGLFLKRAA